MAFFFYNSLDFRIFKFYATKTYVENIFTVPKRNAVSISSHTPLWCVQLFIPRHFSSLFFPVDLLGLDMSRKWNCTMCVFYDWLVSFSVVPSGSSMLRQVSLVCVCHVLFIISHLMDIWVVSAFWLVGIMHQCTSVNVRFTFSWEHASERYWWIRTVLKVLWLCSAEWLQCFLLPPAVNDSSSYSSSSRRSLWFALWLQLSQMVWSSIFLWF